MTKKKLTTIIVLILLIPVIYKVYSDLYKIYGKKQPIPPHVLERMNQRGPGKVPGAIQTPVRVP